MTITINQSTWVTLKEGDTGFTLKDGFTMAYRAGIEVSADCPSEYANIIAGAYKRGWLVPVATVPRTDPTLIWETLRNE
jgi:hypothetical protein